MTLQSWKTWVALAAVVAIVGGFGVWWWRTSGYVSTDDARIKAEVVAVSAELTAKLNSLTKEEGELVTRQEVLATLGSPRAGNIAPTSRRGGGPLA